MKILIREAMAGDLSAARAVYDAAYAPLHEIYQFTDEAAARQSQRYKEGTRLVALRDGQLVGTVQYRQDCDHLHLLGLAVHPDAQKTGVARALICHVAEIAPSMGYAKIALDTVLETGNVAIFTRCGFEEIRVEELANCESTVFDNLHCVVMEYSV